MADTKFRASQEFRTKCTEYVNEKLTAKGGVREACSGFKHRTLPYLVGLETKGKVNIFFASFLKVLPLILGATIPVIARRIYPPVAVVSTAGSRSPKGFDALLQALSSLDFTDACLVVAVVLVTVFSKLIDKYFKQNKTTLKNSHTKMCEMIESLPAEQFKVANNMPGASDGLLKTCLAGIKHEISSLLLDESEKVISDVVYWEFSNGSGKRMRVRSRLVQDKPQRSSVESHLLQAYYIAKTGKVFAEHDFQNKENPFPAERASAIDGGNAAYKSILFVPITITEEEVDSSGEIVDHDYCIGVICVASDRPFRFWRWGDHNRLEGTFGRVAYEHIVPYIQLIRRLAMHGACRVEVNA